MAAGEVCRAFVCWMHADDSARTRMTAADALLQTVKFAFGCS